MPACSARFYIYFRFGVRPFLAWVQVSLFFMHMHMVPYTRTDHTHFEPLTAYSMAPSFNYISIPATYMDSISLVGVACTCITDTCIPETFLRKIYIPENVLKNAFKNVLDNVFKNATTWQEILALCLILCSLRKTSMIEIIVHT